MLSFVNFVTFSKNRTLNLSSEPVGKDRANL